MEFWQNPETLITWFGIFLLILVLLLIIIYILIKSNFVKIIKRNEEIFKNKIKYEKEIKEAILTTQESERKMIAGELHDQISNKLNLIVLKINGIDENENHSILAPIKEDIKELIQKNRDISHYLFPVELENLGLTLALQNLVHKYSTKDLTIKFCCNDKITFENQMIENQIYRIIQESITNTIKHAEANTIQIMIKKFSNSIAVLINDNGKGFEVETIRKGIGLINIETRLKTINSNFKLKSSPNKGTRLIIVI